MYYRFMHVVEEWVGWGGGGGGGGGGVGRGMGWRSG